MSLGVLCRIYPVRLWFALAIGLLVRLVIAWLPVQELVMRFTADDAYYYLTIARNVVSGRGMSFDGIAPTNGFHPLYLMLLIVMFWLTSSAVNLNMHLALSLLSVCNVLTTLPLYATVRRIANEDAALIAAVAWLFNPWVVAITLLGVESALYVLLMAWTIERYTAWQMSEKSRSLVVVGILAGLTVLARTDGIFLVIAVALDLFFRVRWKNGFWLTVILGSCAGLVVFPWLVWNWITFGTLAQTSGMSILYRQQYSAVTSLASSVSYLQTLALMMFQGLIFVLMVCVVRLITCGHVVSRYVMVKRLPNVRFLLAYVVLWFVFYALYFRHWQLWYFLPVLFIATLGVGGMFNYLMRSRATEARGWYMGILALYGISFVLSLWFWSANHLAWYPAQANGYQIARWLDQNTDPQVRIGAWNAGVIGYFSRRAIVNLDGVVNNSLYAYVTHRNCTFELNDVWEYIQAYRVDYLTDYENIFPSKMDAKSAGALNLAHSFPSVFGNYAVVIYRVVRD